MERCGAHPEEVNVEEEQSTQEEEPQGDLHPVTFFKLVLATSSRTRTKVPTYDGILNVKEFMSWINTLGKYFDYEEVNEEKKVKLIVTMMRVHSSIF